MVSSVKGKGAGGSLILEVHSPKCIHELSRVKMLVCKEAQSFAIHRLTGVT